MTKNEIKAALDLAGVTYAKKANLETLQALFDALPPANPETPSIDYDTASYDEVHDSNCPHCGIHLSNGLLTMHDEVANKPGVTLHMEGMNQMYNCMGCGGDFGPTFDPYVAPAPTATGTGLKIEKERPEQNGIKRPSIGGKCRAIWDALDAYREETGELPTSKVVKELAADEGWNPNNASIEFYQWRKFHGIGKAA